MSAFLERYGCTPPFPPTESEGIETYYGSENSVRVTVLKLSLPSEASQVAFARDTSLLSKLDVPSIVKFKDSLFDAPNRAGYIAVEYAEERSLEAFLETHKKVSEMNAYHGMMQLLEAAQAMWSNGLNLRYLCPRHILVAHSELKIELKISIFAVCPSVNQGSETNARGMQYIAPEGNEEGNYSLAADVWTLGVIFAELLTGLSEGRTFPEDFPYLSAFEQHTINFIKSMLQKTPERRLKKDVLIREMQKYYELMQGKVCGKYKLPAQYYTFSTFSTLFKVRNKSLNHPCKDIIIKKIEFTDDHSKTRFLREVANLSLVKSPFIVEYIDCDIKDETGYFMMNFVSDVTLRDYLESQGRVQLRTAFRWFRQITKGLEVLWEQNIVHRNLTSEHVLLTKKSQSADVKLCGFSWSKCVGDNPAHTRQTSVMYFVPEVKLGAPHTDKSDVWQLGVLLYEMTMGVVSNRDDYLNLRRNVRNNEDLRNVYDLFDMMLEPDPNRRISYRDLNAKLANRFTTLGKIGNGTFGEVFLATDSFIGSKVAKKVVMIKEDLKFQREVDTIREMENPYIVELLESYEHQDKLYIYMEFCEGGNLLQFLQGSGPVYEGIARKWMLQLLQGLEHVHGRQVLHRDIKSENILLTKKDFSADLKFTDFGISKFLNEKLNTARIGTRQYMSPERFKGNMQNYSFPSDIWSIACVFYDILEAKPAIPKSRTYDEILEEQKRIPPLRYVSSTCSNLVMQMLQIDDKRRLTLQQCLQHPFFQESRLTFEFSSVHQEECSIVISACCAIQSLVEQAQRCAMCNLVNISFELLVKAKHLADYLMVSMWISEEMKTNIQVFDARLREEISNQRKLSSFQWEKEQSAFRDVKSLVSKIASEGKYAEVVAGLSELLDSVSKIMNAMYGLKSAVETGSESVELYSESNDIGQKLVKVINISNVTKDNFRQEAEYWKDMKFLNLANCIDYQLNDQYAIVSFHIYYCMTAQECITKQLLVDEQTVFSLGTFIASLLSTEKYLEVAGCDLLMRSFDLRGIIERSCFGVTSEGGFPIKYISETQHPRKPIQSEELVWALGILLCEMALGVCLPDTRIEREELLNAVSVLKCNELKNLIRRMLILDPIRRISLEKTATFGIDLGREITLLEDKQLTSIGLINDGSEDCTYIRKLVKFKSFELRLTPHPSLVKCTEQSLLDEMSCFDFEYCKGGNLEEYIKKHGPLHEKAALPWMTQLLDLIFLLHNDGFVHGNLHTEGVVLQSEHHRTELKLLDFRIRNKLNEMCHKSQFKPHLDPEFICEQVGPLSDVWGLGCFFYFLLEGKHLVDQKFSYGCISAKLEEMQVTDTCRDLLSGMLSFNPGTRSTLQQCRDHFFFTRPFSFRFGISFLPQGPFLQSCSIAQRYLYEGCQYLEELLLDNKIFAAYLLICLLAECVQSTLECISQMPWGEEFGQNLSNLETAFFEYKDFSQSWSATHSRSSLVYSDTLYESIYEYCKSIYKYPSESHQAEKLLDFLLKVKLMNRTILPTHSLLKFAQLKNDLRNRLR